MDRLLISRFTLALGTAALLAASPALAADAAHGKQLFTQKCSICHSAAKGAHAVVGRKAASVPGFKYSAAMQAIGYAWTDEKLKPYLVSPRTVVPGTKMVFAGFKDSAQADDVVAYLDTLK